MKGLRFGFKYSMTVCLKMICLLVGLVSLQNVSAKSGVKEMRLMSYNTHHSEGMDKVLDVSRIAHLINLQNPEVIAIQELDSMTERTNKTYQLAELAKLTGMKYTFASALHNYQGGSYGNGILSKKKPLSVKRIPLPGREARVLLVAEFKDYVFASTHLDGRQDFLDQTLDIIRQESARWNKPFFIAGDWNCRPDNKFIEGLKQDFKIITCENSVPFDHPTYCIDYIAVRDKSDKVQTVAKWTVVGSNASDHCPVCGVVKMAQP